MSDNSNSDASSGIDINRRTVLKATGAGALVGLGTASPVSAVTGTSGGPVVLMGIDAEDGNVDFGFHGGMTIYQNLVTDILSQVTNGNSGILAIGAKSGQDTGKFWDAIGTGTSQTVTFASGVTAIEDADFSGYAMVGVSSSVGESPGGLTDAENDALIGRAVDLAALVNGGGGLLGFSQDELARPWAYLGGLGAFTTNHPAQYDDVTATAAGNAVGLTDTNLDVCCWHDTFTAWPSFLDVLATNNETGNSGFGEAAALGGATVVIPTCAVQDTTLVAGQTVDAGTVTVEQVAPGDPLLVTYTTTGDWYMTETHLHVAEDCGGVPQTGSGNPKVGRFEFTTTHAPAVQEYTVEVPLDATWASADTLCVAAHAAVFQDANDNGTFESDVDRAETAWGEGERFTERGNWAMHFEYEVC